MIKPELPFVFNKRSLITALILLFVLIALSLQYPGPHNNAEVILKWLGIPLYSRPQSQTGLHYSGILMLAVFIAMFTFFNHGLTRHRILVFFAALTLLHSAPGWLVSVAKNQRLTGNCQIPMSNLSNAEVKAQPMFQIDLYCNNSPTKKPITLTVLTLMPRAFNTYNVDFDLPFKKNLEISGQSSGIPFTLRNGEQSRTWH